LIPDIRDEPDSLEDDPASIVMRKGDLTSKLTHDKLMTLCTSQSSDDATVLLLNYGVDVSSVSSGLQEEQRTVFSSAARGGSSVTRRRQQTRTV
jgi:hypothetical protein